MWALISIASRVSAADSSYFLVAKQCCLINIRSSFSIAFTNFLIIKVYLIPAEKLNGNLAKKSTHLLFNRVYTINTNPRIRRSHKSQVIISYVYIWFEVIVAIFRHKILKGTTQWWSFRFKEVITTESASLNSF